MKDPKKKIVKTIKINIDKCNGCRACEVICSAFHASPKYSIVNSARSRIRVVKREFDNVFIPVIASAYSNAECLGRSTYISDGNESGECAFCGVSCPSRDLFKEPDSGLPLKCDGCESDLGLEEPLCVHWCFNDVLTYEEREEEVEEGQEHEEIEISLKALTDKFGLDKVTDTIARMWESKTPRM